MTEDIYDVLYFRKMWDSLYGNTLKMLILRDIVNDLFYTFYKQYVFQDIKTINIKPLLKSSIWTNFGDLKWNIHLSLHKNVTLFSFHVNESYLTDDFWLLSCQSQRWRSLIHKT